MRVLNVSTRDTGGTGRNAAIAFNRYAPGWTYHAVKRNERPTSANWLDYPVHTSWAEARALAKEADVFHVNNTLKAARLLGVLHRPLVWHHHGTMFRTHTQRFLEVQRDLKAVGLASTLDLWLLAPDELEWLPAPYDLDWLASLRKPADEGRLRICHAPTNRGVKSTGAFLAAVKKLRREVPVELVLIERQPWKRCLELKGTCDIYFDQVILGYGNNSIEAWGMGVPVIAGAASDTLTEMERRFGSLPFVLADEGSIYDALVSLVEPEARATWAKRGLEHVRQWHADHVVVPQLQDIYRRTVGR